MNRPPDIAALVVTGGLVAVIFLVGALLWRLVEGPRTGVPAEDRARRMRAASWILPILPGCVAALGVLGILVAGKKIRNPAGAWVVMGVFAALALVIHWHFRQKARTTTSSRAATTRPARLWVWLLILAGMGLAIYFLGSTKKPGGPPQPGADRATVWFLVSIPLVLVFVFVLNILIQLRKYRDGAVMRALHRSEEGDVNGAIEELQHEIEMRGPSANRINGLAALYLKNKDYATAEGWCRKGLAIDPERFDLRSNFAQCRLRTGHAEEAEAIYAELTNGPAKLQSVVLENHARALIALRRIDDAEAMLDRADAALNKVLYLTTLDIKGPIRAEIANARAEIAELRGKSDMRGVDSL